MRSSLPPAPLPRMWGQVQKMFRYEGNRQNTNISKILNPHVLSGLYSSLPSRCANNESLGLTHIQSFGFASKLIYFRTGEPQFGNTIHGLISRPTHVPSKSDQLNSPPDTGNLRPSSGHPALGNESVSPTPGFRGRSISHFLLPQGLRTIEKCRRANEPVRCRL